MDTPAIKKEIIRMEPTIPTDSYEFVAAVVLLAVLEVGTEPRVLSHFTGFGISEIKCYLDRWKKNGVIQEGVVHHGGWDDPDNATAVVAFWLDVMVGTGMIVRVEDESRKY